ncbi:MAG: Lrp/AsnC family transcriptional regulator for asnA, asnC and gidA [Bacteriovoracaceae bacterium]|jgi:Lrp/AsnC family transcriptional regulator for asnA, asnC and gidA
MAEKYQIDSTDRQILGFLLEDARIPYLEIARKLIVSGGMVHQRIEKMKEAGIIEGSQIKLNLKNLGYDVTVFLGVHLKSSKKLPDVIKKLKNYPEVLEAHYTTGTYALLLKISTRNISDFHKFLIEKLQSIDEVQSTESFISMDQPIQKGISL